MDVGHIVRSFSIAQLLIVQVSIFHADDMLIYGVVITRSNLQKSEPASSYARTVTGF